MDEDTRLVTLSVYHKGETYDIPINHAQEGGFFVSCDVQPGMTLVTQADSYQELVENVMDALQTLLED